MLQKNKRICLILILFFVNILSTPYSYSKKPSPQKPSVAKPSNSKPSVAKPSILGAHINKHVIGARWVGMFSNFLGVINHIDWCLRNNKIPVVYWVAPCMFYTGKSYNGSFNVWEYYFEPVSPLSYVQDDPINGQYSAPDGSHIYWIFNAETQPSKEKRLDIYTRIIKPFIKLNAIVQKKVDIFFKNNMQGKHTIGIHLRGTDKNGEVKQISPEILLAEAQKHATPDSQFFVATDDNALLEIAKTTLKGNVVYYDSHRADDGKPVHYYRPSFPMEIVGEEVIIEAMLLSMCDKLIHTCSNVSTSVLFLNPELENILMSAT